MILRNTFARSTLLAIIGFLVGPALPLRAQDVIGLGAGSMASRPPVGAKQPPEAVYRTASASGPMPTNDWWSSLAWLPYSERHYPHPLAIRAEPGGLRVYYPGWNITANKAAIFGFMEGEGNNDVLIGHSQIGQFPDARVAAWSDWFVEVQFGESDSGMRLAYGHGSPYVFAKFSGGSPRLTLAEVPRVIHGDARSEALGIGIGKRLYGLFAPSGASWSGLETTTLTAKSDKDYFTLAVLPDATAETFELFRQQAHNHVTDTRVAWKYDQQKCRVQTGFRFTIEAQEGTGDTTLTALYPHQWRQTDAELTGHSYQSVRGTMKLARAKEFQTSHSFPGLLPVLPQAGGGDRLRMLSLLQAELDRPAEPAKDTYWEGKWLGSTVTQARIAQQYEAPEIANALLDRAQDRLQQWFTATENGKLKTKTLFAYEENWGTLIGYPASFGSDQELNDHHFHYGYFIRAAAEVALRDPAWAADAQYGKVVEQLIRDVASPARNDPLYPRLRNFDPYAGHTWAAGHARFGDGNNNESSSEAMNAWAGLILWGEATGKPELRDLGIYLYTTELHAIEEYWFDVHNENHHADYPASVVTMIWGGKGANGTWFSGNPEMVHGINWLPFQGGSTYLGRYPEYVEKNYSALVKENQGTDWDAWADLIWMYRALSDPADAARQMEAGWEKSPREGGNSRANTYHWITALRELGQVEREVTADYPYYGVFRQGDAKRYVVYRFDAQPRTVSFSDGFRLETSGKGFTVGSP